MIQIRENIFETNSSSTHSMVIAMESDFNKWEAGELLYYDGYNEKYRDHKFITKEEALEIIQAEAPEATMETLDEYYGYDYDIWPFDLYCEDRCEYLECEKETFTTPGGEKIRIMCHYGYDG